MLRSDVLPTGGDVLGVLDEVLLVETGDALHLLLDVQRVRIHRSRRLLHLHRHSFGGRLDAARLLGGDPLSTGSRRHQFCALRSETAVLNGGRRRRRIRKVWIVPSGETILDDRQSWSR